MSLSSAELFFIDAQTTGMRPPKASLIEIGWARASASSEGPVHSALIQVPEDRKIPRTVLDITGLNEKQIREGRDPGDVLKDFERDRHGLSVMAAHYCQFEKPFVEDWYGRFGPLPALRFLCLHKLSQILFPHLPSRNIKALAGYFGPPLSEANRAGPHVEATLRIWKALCAELERRGVDTLDGVFELMENAPKAAKIETRRQYRLDSAKRLTLPDQPGVYKMIAQDGKVLYVGKATSLKSRVNSYFRGFRGRDKRKLEMMAQVWDIEVVPCATPLEAALLESDEIKRLNPPYNVVLKDRGRAIFYFRRDFLACSRRPENEFSIGPFRSPSRIEQLLQIWDFFETGVLGMIFFTPVEEALVREGIELFLAEERCLPESLRSPRDLFLIGMKRFRQERKLSLPENEPEEENPGELEEELLTVNDVVDKLHRVFVGAAEQLWRARKMDRTHRALHRDKTALDEALYDRLSILTSAQIKSQNSPNREPRSKELHP